MGHALGPAPALGAGTAGLDGRGVRADLLAPLELAGVEPHGQHRVAAPGLGRLDEPLLCLRPAIGQHLGHAAQFPADQGLEAGTDLRAHVPGPHRNPEYLAQDLGDLVPRQVVHGGQNHVVPSPAAVTAARYAPGPQTYPGTVVLAPEGRKLLRIEARNSQIPIERKPPWIKTRLRTGPEYTALKDLVRSQGLHTVCEEAGCPNIFECWEDREATFLIGGDACTRRCDFCQIATGKPEPLDTGEPRRVAESVAAMGLRYATVTGVARDDLADGGAWLYGQTCAEIHAAIPGCGVELLIPDFNAEPGRLAVVFGSRPEVLAHNIETVPRIFRQIRPGFRYGRSLEVLTRAREAGLVTKSNQLICLGE